MAFESNPLFPVRSGKAQRTYDPLPFSGWVQRSQLLFQVSSPERTKAKGIGHVEIYWRRWLPGSGTSLPKP